MKISKIIISLTILSILSIVNAGWSIPKGCPLEWYEKNKYCPSYYTIWKVKSDIKKFPITEEELLKLDFPLLNIEEWNYYILENNYFYNNWFEKIKESFFAWKWWINMWKVNKWDVIIIDNKIYWYENNEEKTISIESDKYKKNKINFNWNLKTINTYWNYYKVTCKNDNISLSNEGVNYDLWFKNNKIIDKEVSKKIVRNNLQEYIKTCENFNKLFDIKYNYKDNKNYTYKLNKLKISLNKRFWKLLSKITWDKLVKLFEKIEKLREEKNNNKNLNQEKKDNINILLDALIEILK